MRPRDAPLIPPHLEEVFLVWGPPAFKQLIVGNGGMIKASKVAKKSSSTLSRWMKSPPGALFGQRRDMTSYRSLWFGYPSPLPGFDRIIEEIFGDDQSFIGHVTAQYGMNEALKQMRDPTRFGLRMLGATSAQIAQAAEAVGIPAVTRRRWSAGVPYPGPWVALDRLAKASHHSSWLQTVLSYGAHPRRSRKVSRQAIATMVQHILPLV